MQWSSRTEQQLADMVNRAHVRYRLDMYRPTHQIRERSYPQPVYIQPPRQYEPLRPRDALLYGTWIAVVIGFLVGALWGVS